MKIFITFITIAIVFLIASCATKNSELIADLNLAALTAKSEEEFRKTSAIYEVIQNGYKKEKVFNLSANEIWKRVNTCYGNDKNMLQINNAVTKTIFGRTLVSVIFIPASVIVNTGYSISGVIEVDQISSEKSKAIVSINRKMKGLESGDGYLDNLTNGFIQNITNNNCSPGEGVLSPYG